MKFQFIRTEGDHDFYYEREVKVFNIVPKDAKAPEGGYGHAAYILALKGIKQFASEEEAAWYFLGVKQGAFYRNINFKKRDHNCTNVVAVEILQDGKAPAGLVENYEVTDEDFVANLTSLYIQNGVMYYGYL